MGRQGDNPRFVLSVRARLDPCYQKVALGRRESSNRIRHTTSDFREREKAHYDITPQNAIARKTEPKSHVLHVGRFLSLCALSDLCCAHASPLQPGVPAYSKCLSVQPAANMLASGGDASSQAKILFLSEPLCAGPNAKF